MSNDVLKRVQNGLFKSPRTIHEIEKYSRKALGGKIQMKKTKRQKSHDKPIKLNVPLDEAIKRIVRAKPEEIKKDKQN